MYRMRILIAILLSSATCLAQTQRVTTSGTTGAVDIDRGGYGAIQFARIPSDYINFLNTDSLGRIWVKSGNFYYHDGTTRTQVLTAKDSLQIAAWGTASLVRSVFGRIGTVTANNGDYTFAQLGSKPTTLAGYGITDPVVLTSGSYANPTWISSLAYSKLTGTPTIYTTFAGLTDVSITAIADGQLTRYNSGTSKWENFTPSYISGYTETDPVFAASSAFGIAGTDLTHWNEAYNKYTVSGSYGAGTLTYTRKDASTWTVTGLPTGTVTDFIINEANGLNGSVSFSTTIPTVTLFPDLSVTGEHLVRVVDNGGIGAFVAADYNSVATALGFPPIALTDLSSTATGLTYTNTTGVFSLTSGRYIPTTTEQTNWNTAYTNRITSLTTTGSGTATLSSNVLNVPTPTASGLGAVPTSRLLTINGTTLDLSGDQSWSVGTILSVSGTTNRVTVTAGNNPVIDISATFEALLGKIASPLSQFASTTSAQLAGVISNESGTGALVFANSPVFVSPDLGIPLAGVLTTCTGLPLNSGVTGTLPIGSGGTNATTTTSLNALPIAYGANTNLHTPRCITVCTTPSSTLAGSTAETNLLVFSIPAGSLPFPGFLLVTAHYRFVGITGTKTMPIRFGNNSGSTTDYNLGSTGAIVNTQVQGFSECKMWLLTATSQDAFLTAGAATGSVNPVSYGSANTNNICYISFNKTMSSVADSAQLMEFTVWVYSN